MWQKLNRIDTFELKRARNQLINASQLVAAGPSSYRKPAKNEPNHWLHWNNETQSIDSVSFGNNDSVQLSLDIDKFVLSIVGREDNVQHLVLSGITYAMAYGWMQIKMESFGLEGEAYTDNASYQLAEAFGADKEMLVTDQRAFSNLVIYYSNAFDLLSLLKEEFKIEGTTFINPQNLALTVAHHEHKTELGFSPGDEDYPEPYFFVKVGDSADQESMNEHRNVGIWHRKNWKGLVYLASDFLTMEPEVERKRVLEFFRHNYASLLQN